MFTFSERKKKKKKQNMKEDTTKDRKKEQPKSIHEEEDKEDCPICTDALPKLGNQFVRYSCCGKGLHDKCAKDLMENTSMTAEQKNTCIMCRAQLVDRGSKEDIRRLRKWVKKGKVWAMDLLAGRYISGTGVKQSDKKAIELYEMAAKRGDAGAQYNLGLFYDQGMHGLTQSSKRAIEYYTLATEQGHAKAQCNLGTMYNIGCRGVNKDEKRAIEFYTLAAEQGLVQAQFNLGAMYFNGQAEEHSYSKARKWLTKAAAQGHERAIGMIKELDVVGF